MKIKKPLIYNWIKTPCGRAKYTDLAARRGFISFIRLNWFIFFAILRDLKVANPDHFEESSDS